jgi:hypothetical protein
LYIPEIRYSEPTEMLFPIIFVVLVGVIREFIADYRRYQEDRH